MLISPALHRQPHVKVWQRHRNGYLTTTITGICKLRVCSYGICVRKHGPSYCSFGTHQRFSSIRPTFATLLEWLILALHNCKASQGRVWQWPHLASVVHAGRMGLTLQTWLTCSTPLVCDVIGCGLS